MSTPCAYDPSPRLRREFVSMLFALVAAQVAIMAYRVWTASDGNVDNAQTARLAAFAHLFLALMVIVTSWIGWSKSVSADKRVDTYLDLKFLALILDIVIVVFYFFLVSSVDILRDASGDSLAPPSASPEIQWSLILLLLYAVWDAVTKWPQGDDSPKNWPLHALGTSFASILTLGAAAVIYVVNWKWARTPSPFDVILFDVALISVFILFRVLKSAEVVLFEQDRQWRVPTGAPVEPQWKEKTLFLTLVGAVCIGATFFV